MRFSPSSWIGWFPVLFYTTAFIGDLHKRSSSLPLDDPGLDAEATRLGTRALFFSSLVSLAGNVFLPLVVAESVRSRPPPERRFAASRRNMWARLCARLKVSLSILWAMGHLVFAICMFATL